MTPTLETPSPRNEPYRAKSKAWPALRKNAGAALARAGAPGALAVKSYRFVTWTARIVGWKLTSWAHAGHSDLAELGIDVNKVFWISPAEIEFSSGSEFDLSGYRGGVLGGDWDLSTLRFDQLDIYVAMREVFREGRTWTETVFYRRFVKRVENGEELWGCRDLNGVRARLVAIEALYRSIERDGYQTQGEERGAGDAEPVAVCIGRDGAWLFSDGAHRLAAAKLLGIERIPVQVSVRHPEWIAFRRELLLYAQDLGGRLYQSPLHQDLKSIPAFHECEDRFETLRQNLIAAGGTLLDIGANLGYFCQRFEAESFTCHAVEHFPRELYFLRKLRAISGGRFTVHAESVLECRPIREIRFDVVLALNVFHHFLKTKEDYDQLLNLLRHLHAEEMFFQPHLPEDPQMQGAYRNLDNEEFVRLVQDGMGLKFARLIGESADGRRIYHLTKQPPPVARLAPNRSTRLEASDSE